MNLLNLLLLTNLLIGGVLYCSVREHLLNSLLSLEYMVLSVFLLLIMSMEMMGGYYALIYLIMAACEGALGLSILIIMSRSWGGDYLSGLGLMIF